VSVNTSLIVILISENKIVSNVEQKSIIVFVRFKDTIAKWNFTRCERTKFDIVFSL
jgi:hypothetical protein